MKKKIIYFFILFCFFYTGCEPLSSYEYVVKNNSDSIVQISYKWSGTDSIYWTTKTILPHTEQLIDSNESTNGLRDLKSQFIVRYFDTIFVNHNGKPIKKDIYLRSSWNYLTIKPYRNIYTLIIENTNIK